MDERPPRVVVQPQAAVDPLHSLVPSLEAREPRREHEKVDLGRRVSSAAVVACTLRMSSASQWTNSCFASGAVGVGMNGAPAPAGSEGERLVVITGQPANIQMAVQLLYSVRTSFLHSRTFKRLTRVDHTLVAT